MNESFVLPEGSWNNCVLEPWKFIWDVPYVDSPKAFSLIQFFTQTCLSTSWRFEFEKEFVFAQRFATFALFFAEDILKQDFHAGWRLVWSAPWLQCDQKKLPKVFKSCPKMITLEKWWILTPLQKVLRMWEIWANYLLPKALKRCPKSNKSLNLVTLLLKYLQDWSMYVEPKMPKTQ